MKGNQSFPFTVTIGIISPRPLNTSYDYDVGPICRNIANNMLSHYCANTSPGLCWNLITIPDKIGLMLGLQIEILSQSCFFQRRWGLTSWPDN